MATYNYTDTDPSLGNAGPVYGTSSDDTFNLTTTNGRDQFHPYAAGGDDTLNLIFDDITTFSHGHHVRGDSDGSTTRGADTFNFQDVGNVDAVVVGRIEDFDISQDTLQINGSDISSSALLSGSGTTGGFSWRIVEYDADSNDSATDTQQWILIDTGSGYVFYALDGARVTNGNGVGNGGQQEAHFIGAGGGHEVTIAELNALSTVSYVDPQNYVPAGYIADGGEIINDYDDVWKDGTDQYYGSADGDLIAAGLNDDTVRAGAGNDIVWGGSGSDTLYGDNGNDTLYGGTGNDTLSGNKGNDTINGEDGNDFLYGGNGADTISGGDGNDLINGGAKSDVLYGGKNSDDLYGENGDDTIYGQNGTDELYGGNGNDLLFGGAGKDTIHGGVGADMATGGNGADVFVFASGDIVDWDSLSGTNTEKYAALDVITDFAIGIDKIEFSSFNGVSGIADLEAWKTTIDGNVYFVLQVEDTDERVLVDVHDSTTWSQFYDVDNFVFG